MLVVPDAAAAHGVLKGAGEFACRDPAVVPPSQLFEKPIACDGRSHFELRRHPRDSSLVDTRTDWRAVDFLVIAHLPALSINRHDDDGVTIS